jgi:hypothetical protein
LIALFSLPLGSSMNDPLMFQLSSLSLGFTLGPSPGYPRVELNGIVCILLRSTMARLPGPDVASTGGTKVWANGQLVALHSPNSEFSLFEAHWGGFRVLLHARPSFLA